MGTAPRPFVVTDSIQHVVNICQLFGKDFVLKFLTYSEGGTGFGHIQLGIFLTPDVTDESLFIVVLNPESFGGEAEYFKGFQNDFHVGIHWVGFTTCVGTEVCALAIHVAVCASARVWSQAIAEVGNPFSFPDISHRECLFSRSGSVNGWAASSIMVLRLAMSLFNRSISQTGHVDSGLMM